MFSIIKRILRLSGKYRPRVIAGLIFNALKSCCAAFVFFAVLLVMLNIEHLTETVILQAFGIVALSVLGRFLFQYLSDSKRCICLMIRLKITSNSENLTRPMRRW